MVNVMVKHALLERGGKSKEALACLSGRKLGIGSYAIRKHRHATVRLDLACVSQCLMRSNMICFGHIIDRRTTGQVIWIMPGVST
jgi:hypothetical protein